MRFDLARKNGLVLYHHFCRVKFRWRLPSLDSKFRQRKTSFSKNLVVQLKLEAGNLIYQVLRAVTFSCFFGKVTFPTTFASSDLADIQVYPGRYPGRYPGTNGALDGVGLWTSFCVLYDVYFWCIPFPVTVTTTRIIACLVRVSLLTHPRM